MEKYRKYREEIKQMPDSAFERFQTSSLPMSTTDITIVSQAGTPASSISYGGIMESAKKREDPFFNEQTPYQLYLRKKRNVLIAKFALLAIAVIGMTVWFILLQGRK